MFIAPRTKALRHVDRLGGWARGETPAPVTVEWDLSNVCSLKCQACHFAHTHVAGPWSQAFLAKPAGYTATGRFADRDLVTRGLTQMRAADVEAIVWSGGGEPTLYPRFADVLIEAHALGLQQGLYTLGGHITDDIDAVKAALTWVVVSLDAADAETYAAEKGVIAARFDAACDGISRLGSAPSQGHGPTVGVSFLLHALNWHRAPDMLEVARNLGATYATFRPTVHTSPSRPAVMTDSYAWVTDAESLLAGLSEERDVEIDVDRFIECRDWRGHGYRQCHGIALVTSVTPDGRVWVCPNRRGVAGSELGDLRTESFADIWARHPGRWTVDRECRAMCRLHLVNQSLLPVFAPQKHEAFV